MMVPACVKLYGPVSGKKIYGIVFQGFCLSSWVQFLIVNFTLNSIGYNNIFYIYCGVACVGFASAFIPLVNRKNGNKL